MMRKGLRKRLTDITLLRQLDSMVDIKENEQFFVTIVPSKAKYRLLNYYVYRDGRLKKINRMFEALGLPKNKEGYVKLEDADSDVVYESIRLLISVLFDKDRASLSSFQILD